MSHANFTCRHEAAQAFPPKLAEFVDKTLYPHIWIDLALSLRDRSLVTVGALIAGGHLDALPIHLRPVVNDGTTHERLSAAIKHPAFYAGYPAASSASAMAHATLATHHERDLDTHYTAQETRA